MSNISSMITNLKPTRLESNQRLAEAITRSASQQTYYTIRLLVDRDRVEDAYRAYAYFRWLDDQLDKGGMTRRERLQFVERQQRLVEHCYRGEWPRTASGEESMLMDLIRSEREERSGLGSYIHHMMAVMAFDAERRGRLISADELKEIHTSPCRCGYRSHALFHRAWMQIAAGSNTLSGGQRCAHYSHAARHAG